MNRAQPLTVVAVGVPEHTSRVLEPLIAMPEFRLRSMALSEATWPVIARERPSVVLLDAELELAGALLATLGQRLRVPALLLARPEVERRLLVDLLEAGALDAVSMPTPGASHAATETQNVFLDALRAAGSARLGTRPPARPPVRAWTREPTALGATGAARGLPPLVAVAGATGGLDALRVLLAGLPEDGPGMVIAQHGSAPFIGAARILLERVSRLRVQEAEHGARVEPGLALLAPGNRHLRVLRRGDGYRVSISDGPLVSRHRPSADVLFQSVAEAAGSAAIGVILSGTGQDGSEGAAFLKRSGAFTLAQDAATCVTIGMASSATSRGIIDHVVPHTRLASLVLRRAARP